MLQPLGDEEEKITVALEEAEAAPIATQEAGATSDSATPKKRKRGSGPGASTTSGKELTADQKAVTRIHVTRENTDGVVKCVYCDKEISSKNVDRWASHLRGCVKTPEEVKAQIQPARATATMAGIVGATGTRTGNHVPMSAIPGAAGSLAATASAHLGAMPSAVTGGGYNEVFKVHVSKDYMKFNAAHFIAYKVRMLEVEGGFFGGWLELTVDDSGLSGEAARPQLPARRDHHGGRWPRRLRGRLWRDQEDLARHLQGPERVFPRAHEQRRAQGEALDGSRDGVLRVL